MAGRALAAGGPLMAAPKTSFYYSFLVLPADQRRAIIAVWEFCRAVDDAVDEIEPGGPLSPRQAVDEWRAELRRCFRGESPLTAQGRRLQPIIGEFGLEQAPFDDVIDGVAMDLDHTRYETFDDLLQYCRRVASAVGMICIRIFRCQHPGSSEYALHLGVALQLTNIIRDVKEDLARGRLYLPLEDLRRAGCSVDELARGEVTESVRRLLAFECDRAREFYARAVAARPDSDRRRLVAAEIMRAVYSSTLGRIERRGYDVFSTRVRTPKPLQAAIALRQWLFQT
jgi:phytoene synthase